MNVKVTTVMFVILYRLVPDIKLDLGSQDDNDSQFSRENKVNLLQSEFSLQPGGGEGDAVSLQSFSSGSSMVPGKIQLISNTYLTFLEYESKAVLILPYDGHKIPH